MSIKRMKIKHMAITRGIKHWGLGGYASILPRIKFVVTGQESSPQSPTTHTATVTGNVKKVNYSQSIIL